MENKAKRNLLRTAISLIGAGLTGVMARAGFESLHASDWNSHYMTHGVAANICSSGAGLLFWESCRRFLENNGCLQEYLPLPTLPENDAEKAGPQNQPINRQNHLKKGLSIIAFVGISLIAGHLIRVGYEALEIPDLNIESHLVLHGFMATLISTFGAIATKEIIEEACHYCLFQSNKENQLLVENHDASRSLTNFGAINT